MTYAIYSFNVRFELTNVYVPLFTTNFICRSQYKHMISRLASISIFRNLINIITLLSVFDMLLYMAMFGTNYAGQLRLLTRANSDRTS